MAPRLPAQHLALVPPLGAPARAVEAGAGALPAAPQSLWSRDFSLSITSGTAATLAVQIQSAAVAYQLYEITRNPLSLGTIGLAEAVPFLFLALVGGHVADTVDRRRVVLGALTIMTVAATALLLMSQFRARLHLSTGVVELGIYLVIAVGGICRSFLQPARIALSAQIVPRVLFPRAIAWRSISFQAGSVLGPACGGLLYGWVGGPGAYLASAALFLVAWSAMVALRAPPLPVATAPQSMLASVREGVRFLAHEPILLPTLLLDLFAVLFGGAVALLPVFAEEILRVGPKGFGLLRAAPAAGALLATGILAVRPPMNRAGRTLLVSVAGFGLCIIAFGLSRSFALSMLLLAGSGAADMVSVLVRSTLVQLRVPEGMLGRVSSLNQIFIGSSNEIGAFESGVAARLLGTVPSVLVGGVATLAVVAVTAWRAPAATTPRAAGVTRDGLPRRAAVRYTRQSSLCWYRSSTMPLLSLAPSDPTVLSARARSVVFEDPRSQVLLRRIELLAPTSVTLCITGETGTGKEIVARHIHALSQRSNRPFFAVNCGAFSETLVESELFGHERGAFTGATEAKAGWFESADGGTLFLDEIGDLPPPLQVKLLRVLQEREVVRLGSRRAIPIDVRLIAATNVDLAAAVTARRFREDLFYRLNVAGLFLPPLRERPGDVLPLALHFLAVHARRLGTNAPRLTSEAEARLLEHPWPGNIRELENAIHHAVLVCRDERITPVDLHITPPPAKAFEVGMDGALEDALLAFFEQNVPNLHERIEGAVIRTAYRYCDRNQVQTARLLGVSRNVVRARLAQFGELGRPLRSKDSEAPISAEALRAQPPEGEQGTPGRRRHRLIACESAGKNTAR